MTMLERVSRLLCRQAGGDPDFRLLRQPPILGWSSYIDGAREVIKVIREPTDAMHDAGRAEMVSNTTGSGDGGYGFEIDDAEPDLTWRAMIDAILEEKA